jgi:hypothetical protein
MPITQGASLIPNAVFSPRVFDVKRFLQNPTAFDLRLARFFGFEAFFLFRDERAGSLEF